jgi:hypothetical protein
MKRRRLGAIAGLLAALSMLPACGGGGGSSSSGATASAPTTSTPSRTTNPACSLRSRQDWAAAQLAEWYLFPETLPASLDPSPYATVADYVDALTAAARAQGRDRHFTYLTSIAEEDSYYASGSSAGFGIRLAADAVQRRVVVSEAFEGAPARSSRSAPAPPTCAVSTRSSPPKAPPASPTHWDPAPPASPGCCG